MAPTIRKTSCQKEIKTCVHSFGVEVGQTLAWNRHKLELSGAAGICAKSTLTCAMPHVLK